MWLVGCLVGCVAGAAMCTTAQERDAYAYNVLVD